ncbi:MAG: asparagine synthase (glutamine-hydrolyzing) [Gammaproteobacteria bacterium]|nr:asparagine synthase (glutamine-hydrolyzing) [Gammaproteobacteria bacterium]
MCGIAGIVTNKTSNYIPVIKQMNYLLAHRGPDGEGIWADATQRVHFGHTRLAIIDLSTHASQPMLSVDGRFVLVFNGEIYNYLELRALCEKQGSQFNSQSDSEVIIECYRHWGEKAFKLFNGMWSFALYDQLKDEIVLCRDPFAIKPLYYVIHNQTLYFASEIKALKAINSRFNEVDEVSVQLFAQHGYLDREDWTFYHHIKRFPHAHYTIINLKTWQHKMTLVRYWSPPLPIQKINKAEATEQLTKLLIKSITLHLRSDVSIAACLSGGLDSSAIVCISAKNNAGNLEVFTTHYPEHLAIDESLWAKHIANHVSAKHHFATPRYDNFVNEFDKLLDVQDEPFGSLSIFAQYTLFKKIKEQSFKVALSGQGADEQFAGYHGYFNTYLESLLFKGNLFGFAREFYYLNKHHQHKLNGVQLVKKVANRLTSNNKVQKHLLGNADEYHFRMNTLLQPYINFDDTLVSMLTETNLPQLLRYEDRNSMGQSIESRVPFLDKDLVDFCLSLPSSLKINKGYTKAILRDALKNIVPDNIRLRMDKLGYPVPESEWLKKAYNMTVTSNGSRDFRDMIVDKWRARINQ